MMTKKFVIEKAWLILDDGSEVEVKPLAENAIPISEHNARGGYGNIKMTGAQHIRDGEILADKIYSELLVREFLNFDDIIKIMDNLDFSLFRKSERIAWNILYSKSDVMKVTDNKGRIGIKLIQLS